LYDLDRPKADDGDRQKSAINGHSEDARICSQNRDISSPSRPSSMPFLKAVHALTCSPRPQLPTAE
ncbi:MAG: hypothetical protein ACOH2P_23620, partial [Pseudomonas sp.]